MNELSTSLLVGLARTTAFSTLPGRPLWIGPERIGRCCWPPFG